MDYPFTHKLIFNFVDQDLIFRILQIFKHFGTSGDLHLTHTLLDFFSCFRNFQSRSKHRPLFSWSVAFDFCRSMIWNSGRWT